MIYRLRRCDFAMQNHRAVEVAGPYKTMLNYNLPHCDILDHFTGQDQAGGTGDKRHAAGDLALADGGGFLLPARGGQGLLLGMLLR